MRIFISIRLTSADRVAVHRRFSRPGQANDGENQSSPHCGRRAILCPFAHRLACHSARTASRRARSYFSSVCARMDFFVSLVNSRVFGHFSPSFFVFSFRFFLSFVFCTLRSLDVDWSAPGELFPRAIYLLVLSEFRESALAGLCVSVGGLTESLVRHSGNSLLALLMLLPEAGEGSDAAAARVDAGVRRAANVGSGASAQESVSVLCLPVQLPAHAGFCANISADLLALVRMHRGEQRVVQPVWKTINLMLENDAFRGNTASVAALAAPLFASIRSELRAPGSGGDVGKSMAAATMYVALLGFGGAHAKELLIEVLLTLAHKFPKIRKFTSELLYSRLLISADLVPDAVLDDTLSLLMETPWDGAAPDAIAAVERLLALLHLALPATWAKITEQATAASSAIAARHDESMTYKDLVRDFHY